MLGIDSYKISSVGSVKFDVEINIHHEINKDDITDINIATDKRHKELTKDFKSQMKEGLPKLKDLVL